MQLKESTRRYILLGLIGIVVIGLIVANVLANNQDEQFTNEQTLYQQAVQSANQGNYEDASLYIKEVLKNKPNSEDVNYLGALIATNTGDLKQAAILFQKTLDINPYRVEDALFMLQFGEVLYNVERYEDAKIVLTRCQEAGWAPESYPGYQERVTKLLSAIENK